MAEPISPARYRFFGAVLMLCAVYFVYVGASRPPGLNSSPWVMYVLAVTWFAVGVRLLELSRGNPGRGTWIGFIACAGMGLALVSIPFDGHPEACHGGISLGPFVIDSPRWMHGSNFCQGVFGAGGLLFIVFALIIAWRAIASRFRKKSYY